MSKTTVILKQQTPLIHFQAEQEGAILRASELRPKIDKFIIDSLEDFDKELFDKYKKEIYQYFKIPYDKDKKVSPVYKLNITTNGRKEVLFYSGSINKYKKTELKEKGIKWVDEAAYFGTYNSVLYNSEIYVHIFSYNPNITSLIKEAIRYVCVFENFGTRQSKGFGSFVVKGMSEDEYIKILNKKYNKIYYKEVTNGYNVQQQIHNDYQILKSGINNPKKALHYKKSLLMEYMSSKKIHWEKRIIKDSIKRNHKDISMNIMNLNKKENENKTLIYKKGVYARAMLGLASTNEYRCEKGTSYIVNIKSDSRKGIVRFKSPLLFKVFENKIYIVANDIGDNMFDTEFKMTIKRKKDRSMQPRSLVRINTPSKLEFNINEFLEFASQDRDFGYKEVKTNE